MVWYGLVLSVVVVSAAIWFANQDNENAPALDWIDDFIAIVVAGVALVAIWVGVLLAKLPGKHANRKQKPPHEP